MPYSLVKCTYGWRVDPTPSQSELEEYYRKVYYQDPRGQYQKNYDSSELTYFLDTSNLVLDFAESHGVATGNVLDLGCGEGFFMAHAKLRGFGVWGADFSDFGLKAQNPEVLTDDNFAVGDVTHDRVFPDQSFDLVFCKNVLEHVIDPVSTVKTILSYLKPGGLAVIYVPNDFSELHQMIFGGQDKKSTPMFVPPVHLHYFNARTLHGFIEDCGAEVLDCYGDYPIDHLLMSERFNYYSDRSVGPDAHVLRKKFHRYLASIDKKDKLQLLRSMYTAGLGRGIAAIFRQG